MAYSVQKSRLAKVAGVSLVLLLAACSSDSRYKRQVSGDEAYLQASPLSELHAPHGDDPADSGGRLQHSGGQQHRRGGQSAGHSPMRRSRWRWSAVRGPSLMAIPRR